MMYLFLFPSSDLNNG